LGRSGYLVEVLARIGRGWPVSLPGMDALSDRFGKNLIG